MSQPQPQVGEIWRDKDERSRGAGEFTVLAVGPTYATVKRHATNRTVRILVRRMTEGQYIRIGVER